MEEERLWVPSLQVGPGESPFLIALSDWAGGSPCLLPSCFCSATLLLALPSEQGVALLHVPQGG